jgi:hypothetical protein
MKAIVQDRYGSPDALRPREVDQPVAADNEVLVRVHAAAVNAHGWHTMRAIRTWRASRCRRRSGSAGPNGGSGAGTSPVGWRRSVGT